MVFLLQDAREGVVAVESLCHPLTQGIFVVELLSDVARVCPRTVVFLRLRRVAGMIDGVAVAVGCEQ